MKNVKDIFPINLQLFGEENGADSGASGSENAAQDAQEAAELNRRLTDLAARLKDRPEVTIEYFVPDDRKAGGAYVTMTGVVRHISVPEMTLVMEDGAVIALEDIATISGFPFEI